MPRRPPPSLALAALACLVLATPGCRRADGCPAGKVCLRYMAWGNPEQLAVEQEMIEAFNAQNPDLHVRLFRVPGSAYAQKAVLMLASRTAPDVMRVDHYNFPQLVERRYFRDLTPYLQKDPDVGLDDFWPTAIEECTVGGRLYGLNVLFGGILMYYNKDLFAQAGLEDPYILWKRGEWTWERMRQAAKAITKRDEKGRPKVVGLTIPPFPNTIVAAWGHGGELLSADMKTSLADDPGTIQGYQYWADLVWKDRVAPTPAQGANAAFTFESGKVGFVFDWMGMTPRYRAVVKSFAWDVCPIPRGPVGGQTCIKGNQLVVSANSPNPDAAWRFVKYLTSAPSEKRLYAEIRRCFPTRKSVATSPTYLETDKPPFQMDAFLRSVETGRVLPIDERWGEWTQIFNSEVDNLMAGRERDAGVVLRRAKRRIDEALAEDPGF
ncbi:MAG: sugar ABC transporter substrate-binding protein [Fimbriimonadaceae bacterium]|nr:sugar ABC transporter substrate-binding protein [Fimbriimonadaceae bacterium]